MGYWLVIYFLSLFKGEMRFSTLGFLAMYLMMFITYYDFIIKGTFTLNYFQNILKSLIIAYGIILILQQCCLLVGIRNMPIINLQNQFFLSITKLPSLTLEPSHSARILTVAMLGYLRCEEISISRKLTLREIFDSKHRRVIALFFWAMLTMGSGTAFVGIAILSLYFITRHTAIYVVPLLLGCFILGQSMELQQMKRVEILAKASMTGNTKKMQEEEGSGAVRIIPVLNLFTKTDLTKKETWIGQQSMKKDKAWWLKTDKSIIDQYGLIAFLISMLLVYSCMIHRFFSIETLFFLFFMGFSINNIYYSWGCLMVMTTIGWLQKQKEQGILITENEMKDE
ncbi:hypothetical protein [Bacteroides stercorirosoris]|nr:hypothetical protein [Bacteroides stercorirosoris]